MSAQPVAPFSWKQIVTSIREDNSLRRHTRALSLVASLLGLVFALREVARLFTIYFYSGSLHFMYEGKVVEVTYLWHDSAGGLLLAVAGLALYRALAPAVSARAHLLLNVAAGGFALLAAWEACHFAYALAYFPSQVTDAVTEVRDFSRLPP